MKEFTFLAFVSIYKWKSQKLVSFLSVEWSGLLAPMNCLAKPGTKHGKALLVSLPPCAM